MPEEGSWRTSSAYDYVDSLNTSDLAWEFLRRNPDYRREFTQLQNGEQADADKILALLEHWGLSFRYRPSTQCLGDTDLLDPNRRPVQNYSQPVPGRACRRTF
ncbi:transcriptional regulator domain-containing protein [Foliimonas ilicis]